VRTAKGCRVRDGWRYITAVDCKGGEGIANTSLIGFNELMDVS